MAATRTGNRVPGSSYEPQEVRVNLTQAQLRALHTTSVAVLDAPAADNIYIVSHAFLIRGAGGTAYSAGAFRVRYGASGSDYAASLLGVALGATAAVRATSGSWPGSAVASAETAQVGEALELLVDASLGSSGTDGATLVVHYYVLTGLE